MKYGIKVKWDDGVETWMTLFPEHDDAEVKVASYNSYEQAEGAAENMRLKNYRIEEIG
jgi:hypothetical protein